MEDVKYSWLGRCYLQCLLASGLFFLLSGTEIMR